MARSLGPIPRKLSTETVPFALPMCVHNRNFNHVKANSSEQFRTFIILCNPHLS